MCKFFIITRKGFFTAAILLAVVITLNTCASAPAEAHPGHGNVAPTHAHGGFDKQHAKGKPAKRSGRRGKPTSRQ